MRHSTGTLVFMLPNSGGTAIALSEHRVSVQYAMPVHLEAWLRVPGRTGATDAPVALQASLCLSALGARVTFRDHPTPTPSLIGDLAMQLPLVAAGERVVRPWQTLRGMPARSRVTLRVVDRDGATLARDRVLGELEGGFQQISIPFDADLGIVAWVAARDWSEQRGPRIRVSGELVLTRGVTLQVAFEPLASHSEGSSEGSTDLQVVRPGTSLYLPEKLIESGRADHTWVGLQFTDGTGRAIDAEQIVGRCTPV